MKRASQRAAKTTEAQSAASDTESPSTTTTAAGGGGGGAGHGSELRVVLATAADEAQQQPQQRPAARTGEPAAIPAFIGKLLAMLSDPNASGIIEWSPAGTSLRVMNAPTFAKEMLPRYFKHSNFTSFVRQLNMYGFHKIVGVIQNTLQSGDESWEFSNPYVKRDQPELLKFVRRNAPPSSASHPAAGSTAPLPLPTQTQEATAILAMSPGSAAAASQLANANEMKRLVTELQHIKSQQRGIKARLDHMEQDNIALQKTVAAARDRHDEQDKVLKKILTFLAAIYAPGRTTLSGVGTETGNSSRLAIGAPFVVSPAGTISTNAGGAIPMPPATDVLTPGIWSSPAAPAVLDLFDGAAVPGKPTKSTSTSATASLPLHLRVADQLHHDHLRTERPDVPLIETESGYPPVIPMDVASLPEVALSPADLEAVRLDALARMKGHHYYYENLESGPSTVIDPPSPSANIASPLPTTTTTTTSSSAALSQTDKASTIARAANDLFSSSLASEVDDVQRNIDSVTSGLFAGQYGFDQDTLNALMTEARPGSSPSDYLGHPALPNGNIDAETHIDGLLQHLNQLADNNTLPATVTHAMYPNARVTDLDSDEIMNETRLVDMAAYANAHGNKDVADGKARKAPRFDPAVSGIVDLDEEDWPLDSTTNNAPETAAPTIEDLPVGRGLKRKH
ncbi:hypothetical protein CAOG_06646 [Capsaspora owczarzaki ATCC 30864]|uniref:HSF-type DNA-binding domain-containing protein n=1 Tax=Capsaspora owczarzaki (strain ATCC 30864) TaxID=595528 RepID=A0A0D2X4M2_CAPO3|nr:hypothetical protein CAOG_06646 [Capsaspora owczarzaki ATCC 30864]KJE96304.1 hypothetical protein CAOG_006646 [Capsaspora owczarzaki ATCC 30864]|eukprot:XP_004344267.1 hypothetical protein CAOG_06646 [Capsaspora owczarzaki ATCC 30864]